MKISQIPAKGSSFSERKAQKLAKLEEACANAIIQGFDFTINGISYHFNYGITDQLNFQGANTVLQEGLTDAVPFTVLNNSTGAWERISIDKPTMDALKMTLFSQSEGPRTRLRDVLEPSINALDPSSPTWETDLDAVKW